MPGSDLCLQHSGIRPPQPRSAQEDLRRVLARHEKRNDPREAELVALLREALTALTGDAP